jgi:hypothetical protein
MEELARILSKNEQQFSNFESCGICAVIRCRVLAGV